MKNSLKIDWSKFAKPSIKTVQIDNYGNVDLKTEMSGQDLVEYYDVILSHHKNDSVNNAVLSAHLVRLMVVNEDGEPVFQSVEDVLKLPSELIMAIARNIQGEKSLSDGSIDSEAKK